jgi:hypothetical protein
MLAPTWRPSLLAVHRGRVPPGTLAPKRQVFLDVQAMTALFPQLPAFASEEHQQAAIAEPNAALSELA